MRIVSWNVNGLRSILGKGFPEFLRGCGADVVCLQEVRATPAQIACDFGPYTCLWNPAGRAGYAGTAVLTRIEPLSARTGIGQAESDAEGRVLSVEFPDWWLVNAYVPNAGPELARLGFRVKVWAPAFLRHLEKLDRKKPVVVVGDMNVAIEERDLARPRENVGRAGFTVEERASFRELLDAGFTDSFREFEPDGGHYSWWSYRGGARQRNVGWRIDYACISERLRPRLREAFLWPQITGSDHCPAGLTLDGAVGSTPPAIGK